MTRIFCTGAWRAVSRRGRDSYAIASEKRDRKHHMGAGGTNRQEAIMVADVTRTRPGGRALPRSPYRGPPRIASNTSTRISVLFAPEDRALINIRKNKSMQNVHTRRRMALSRAIGVTWCVLFVSELPGVAGGTTFWHDRWPRSAS